MFHRSLSRLLLRTIALLLFVAPLAKPIFAVPPKEEIAQQVPAARAILDKWQAQEPQPAKRFLRLVYWTPGDREPAPRYRERLSKIFTDVQAFYAREMERNGFGPRTFQLVREDDGLCQIHLVQGAEPFASYARESGRKIRQECIPVLQSAGLDPEQETIVIFCNMSTWDAEARKMKQNSPYYASGTNRAGTAWQVDSPLLDLDLLTAREPLLQDGEYGRISPGRYNSIFIGGIAHELGHALGLPHDKERPDQAVLWGAALMGSGNRTYGEDLRGEGLGSFLTLSEAMRLASHPALCGSSKGLETKANAQFRDVKIEPQGKRFTFSAQVVADPPVYAVIGATDPAGHSNYDATTATAVPDQEGRFTLECDALTPGQPGLLHIIAAQANGAMTSFASFGDEPKFPYYVEADGTVDFTSTFAQEKLEGVISAVRGRRKADAQAAVLALEHSSGDAKLLKVARALTATLQGEQGPAPNEAEGVACTLSTAATVETKVGYGQPSFDLLPGQNPLLQAGGQVFAHGLYAHAPARHVWSLGGKWKRLAGQAGVAEGHQGTVVFSIRVNDREIWHSRRLEAGSITSFDVAMQDAQQLELIVSDGGDGNRDDWGLWLEPVLTR